MLLATVSIASCDVQAFLQHLESHPSLLPSLLYSIFEIVLFDECFNQWSLSRPMLSLILVITMTQEQVRTVRMTAYSSLYLCTNGCVRLRHAKSAIQVFVHRCERLLSSSMLQHSRLRHLLMQSLLETSGRMQELGKLKARLIATQAVEKQAVLEESLDKLMKEVDHTLDSKNRDRFTQNLSPVRHEIKSRNWQ